MTWLLNNLGRVGELLATHTLLALSAIVAAAVLSVPLGRLAVGSRSIGGVVLSALALLYAVPSLPMLVVIPVILGIPVRSPLNMVIVLTLYGIAVLITQVAEAFRSLPRDVIEAANWSLACAWWRRRRCRWSQSAPWSGFSRSARCSPTAFSGSWSNPC